MCRIKYFSSFVSGILCTKVHCSFKVARLNRPLFYFISTQCSFTLTQDQVNKLCAMETDDLIKLPACSNSEHGSETDDPCASGSEAIKSDFLPLDAKVVDEYNTEAPTTMSDGLEEDMDIATTPDVEKEVDDNPPPLPVGFEMTDAVSVEEKVVSVSSGQAENGSLSIQNEISFRSLKENESLLSKRVVDASRILFSSFIFITCGCMSY